MEQGHRHRPERKEAGSGCGLKSVVDGWVAQWAASHPQLIARLSQISLVAWGTSMCAPSY